MIGRRQVPNAIDAVKLCRYLGVLVEEIFGSETGPLVVRRPATKQAIERRAYALRPGAYRPDASWKLIGPVALVEPEDAVGRKGLVPVVSPIAAGEPREAHDKGFPAGAADAFVPFETSDPGAFALRVDGDSMSPDFPHGDLIVASPRVGHKTAYRDGMLAVVIFGSERTATFKLMHFGGRDRRDEPLDYLLCPINEAHPKQRLKRGEIAAIYPLIGCVRRADNPGGRII